VAGFVLYEVFVKISLMFEMLLVVDLVLFKLTLCKMEFSRFFIFYLLLA
jgi:hypothetical protein